MLIRRCNVETVMQINNILMHYVASFRTGAQIILMTWSTTA